MSIRKLSVVVALFAGGGGVISVTAATTYTWTGAVSSDWSEPGNWDKGVPQNGGNVTLAPADHLPTNQDIDDLQIETLTLGTGYPDNALTISGKKLRIKKSIVDSSTSDSPTIFVIENDITIDSTSMNVSSKGGNLGKSTEWMSHIHLKGVVSDNGTNIPTEVYSGGQGFVHLENTNTFHGVVVANLGQLVISSDAALGVPMMKSDRNNLIYLNSGNLTTAPAAGSARTHVTLDAVRSLYNNNGYLYLDPRTDLTFNGPWVNGRMRAAQLPYDKSEPSFCNLGGDFSTVGLFEALNGVIVRQTTAIPPNGTESLRSSYGTLDFNGIDAVRPLTSHTGGVTDGVHADANFINSVAGTEVEVKGTVQIGYHNGSAYFGGRGDIRVTGDIVDGNTSTKNAFWHADAGCLTLASENVDWGPNYIMTFSGGKVVIDRSIHNTQKLVSVANGEVKLGSELTLVGGDTEAAEEIVPKMTLDDGTGGASFSRIHVKAGDADATLRVDKLTPLNQHSTLDISVEETGTGKARVVFPNTANDETFSGFFFPGYTWNKGATFAKLDADHVVGPMDEADYSAEPTGTGVWDVAGGEVALDNGAKLYGVRCNAAAGTTIVIGDKKKLTWEKVAKPMGFLMTPSSGDVTIRGGTMDLGNYHGPIHLMQFNSTRKMRIETQIVKTINMKLAVSGCGEVEIVNDANTFDGEIFVDGSSTLAFTSIADKGLPSALGDASNENSTIRLGNGSTLKYIGTAAAGHETDRGIRLAGNAMITANGAGPLHLKAPVTQVWCGSYDLTLAGSGEGVLDGGIKTGWLGSFRKTGSGTWTLNAEDNDIHYPSTVEAGTLVLNGALPCAVTVAPGAVLKTGGCLLKRDLALAGTLTYVAAGEKPVKVCGHAKLSGALALSGRLADEKTILTAVSIEGTFDDIPAGVKVIYSETSVTLKPIKGLIILVR